MESVLQKYMNWREIKNFMNFLKKSANWLCLVKDDFNENCFMHQFLIGAENKIGGTYFVQGHRKSRISDIADEQLLYKSGQYAYLFSNENEKSNKRR